MSDAITVRYVCGCEALLGSGEQEQPQCVEHGERRIAVVHAPPPRFTAVQCAVEGPHVVNANG